MLHNTTAYKGFERFTRCILQTLMMKGKHFFKYRQLRDSWKIISVSHFKGPKQASWLNISNKRVFITFLDDGLSQSVFSLHRITLENWNVSRRYACVISQWIQTSVKFASTHHGPKPSPSDERKPVRMFRRNTGTIEAQVCHELETTGTPASPSTVKPAVHYHELRGC